MKRPNICENFVSGEGDVGSNVYVSNIECPGEAALVLRNHPSHRSLPFTFAWGEKYYRIWPTILTRQDTKHQIPSSTFLHNTCKIIAQKRSDMRTQTKREKVIRVALTRSSWRGQLNILSGEEKETLPMSRKGRRDASFISQCVSKTFYPVRNVSLSASPFQTIYPLLTSMQKSLLGLLKNCDTIFHGVIQDSNF